ncbi:fumarylacetoacetate hydrolase family protein [Talaromyces proteolyticus]|uniref:Fumarylacetoacetate hydrolase family protein n=1 Tax=Talaromyces proteolyticus TaxID=1131652 RepID=A0AAD4KH84_9EURO|nr:fumarylacetoacetate hydrolase family protein [Talaromyces proteolyticus]KAH8691142.1 fumarylacetoacetate hydrolase family protein [Talaromyces proteolyticus]
MLRSLATMASSFSRLVRFVPKSDPSKIFIGEPVDTKVDVGVALYEGKDVQVKRFSGSSILEPGEKTDGVESIKTLLSPLAQKEVGTIRCIGLNYVSHAAEMGLALPEIPTVFLKPATALSDPWPALSILPKITQKDNTGDYESELAIIIGKDAKNVSEADALDYVLGYTAANDVSSRTSQNKQSQWCFSKGFDSSCPLGPVVASSAHVSDASKLRIRGAKNGAVVQDCGLTDMIFTVSQLVSFLSQGTTLPAGTVILTGTPPGVGAAKKPPQFLKEGDEFRVSVEPYIGTLITQFKNEE